MLMFIMALFEMGSSFGCSFGVSAVKDWLVIFVMLAVLSLLIEGLKLRSLVRGVFGKEEADWLSIE